MHVRPSTSKPVPLARPQPRVSARIAAIIALRLHSCSIPPEPLLQAAGLSPAHLHDPDARIPLAAEEQLWAAAARACGDPLFGLNAAQCIQPGRFDALDYVVRTAPTLRESLERLARYNRLLHDVASFTLACRAHDVRVEHGFGSPARPASPHAAEFTLASLVVVGRQLSPRLRVTDVEFAHAPMGPPDAYERVFATTPRFHRPANALAFPNDLLDTPLPAADPVLSRIVTAHAEQVLRALGSPDESASQRLRRFIAERIATGPPTLEQAADHLHVSTRHLQRILRTEGQSFAGLVDGTRRELALRWLADPALALGEVAYLLGFSEPSPFHRAFRRWTGMTPSAFRSSRAANPARERLEEL